MTPKKRYPSKNKTKKLNNKTEILSIIAIAINVYFIISIFFPGSGGFIGTLFSNFLIAIIGIGAFLLPFIIIMFCIYNLLSNYASGKRIGVLTLIFILSLTFFHIINGDNASAIYIFNHNLNYNFSINGGAVGAVLGNSFITIFGTVGTTILITSFLIVLTISLTERSFFKSLSNLKDSFLDKIHKFKGQYKHNVSLHNDEIINTEYIAGKILPSNLYHKKGNYSAETLEGSNFTLLGENKKHNNTNEQAIEESIPNQKEDVMDIKIKNEDQQNEVNNEIEIDFEVAQVHNITYQFPTIKLLNNPPKHNESLNKSIIYENTRKLEQTLKDFGVIAKVLEVSKGPTVTRYELAPGTGVKVSKISSLSDDLALNLAAKGIRIEAPIPGKSAVGIEIPNETPEAVFFREIIETNSFKTFPSNLAFALGKDIAGGVMVTDLAKMPHLLIAGATGSGKSVCINTLIVSLLYKSSPEKVKLIMIDPKVVELSVYNGIPHLLIPVVTDPKKAAGALNWAVKEMLKRYDSFATTATRDLKNYNQILENEGKDTLPQIVIIIDELADLMMVAPGEVEDSICRLAQMARAAGIHLIIATQRPSVDVITGLIKANIPSRLAFSVSSGTDSRTILDTNGAEKLLGRGDMLFFPIGMQKPIRIQGAFISDKEVENIVSFLKSGHEENYDEQMVESITSSQRTLNISDDVDEFFEDAVIFVIEKEKASASMLQRQFRIGYQRASRIIDHLQEQGIIGPEDGSKPRKVLLTKMAWEEMKPKTEN